MAKQQGMQLGQYTGIVHGATQRTPDARIKLNLIDVEKQVRTTFDPERQASLNASTKAHGILQPVIVLAKPDGRYRLIAGEYRLRAARANEFDEIPVVIKHNLTPQEIRAIQVSENNDRANLSPADEARGVAEDAAIFGFEAACAIWNRSEGWVSKRVAVTQYADPVKQLVEDEVCGDLEVTHSLNQIYGLDQQEFARLEKRLRDGLPLSREEARGKVQQVKEWLNESKQRAERREALSRQKPAGNAPAAPTASPAGGGPAAKAIQVRNAAPAAVLTSAPAASSTAAPPAKQEPAAPSPGLASGQAVPSGAPAAPASAQITEEQAVVLEQMVAMFKNGVANHTLVKAVQDELVVIGANMNQSEWAMWSLYQTVVLPLLAALGESRAPRYLQRTLSELRSATPQEIWSELHPTVDGKASDDWTASREPVARMPEKWHF